MKQTTCMRTLSVAAKATTMTARLRSIDPSWGKDVAPCRCHREKAVARRTDIEYGSMQTAVAYSAAYLHGR